MERTVRMRSRKMRMGPLGLGSGISKVKPPSASTPRVLTWVRSCRGPS